MTDASATHADFANPEHDFPQRIRYAREGDLLRAEISGGQCAASNFVFAKSPAKL